MGVKGAYLLGWLGWGRRLRRVLSTPFTPLIAVSVHFMDRFTMFVTHIEPCSISPVELEISRFTCCNTSYVSSCIFSRWYAGFDYIARLEPIKDLGLLRFSNRKAVLIGILNLTAAMPISLDEQGLNIFCV